MTGVPVEAVLGEGAADLLRKLMYEAAPKKHKFPRGFRWLGFRVPQQPRFREWLCCWTTTPNENGKFLSFVYERRGDRSMATREREHRRRNAAKARALKLYAQRSRHIRETTGGGQKSGG